MGNRFQRGWLDSRRCDQKQESRQNAHVAQSNHDPEANAEVFRLHERPDVRADRILRLEASEKICSGLDGALQ